MQRRQHDPAAGERERCGPENLTDLSPASRQRKSSNHRERPRLVPSRLLRRSHQAFSSRFAMARHSASAGHDATSSSTIRASTTSSRKARGHPPCFCRRRRSVVDLPLVKSLQQPELQRRAARAQAARAWDLTCHATKMRPQPPTSRLAIATSSALARRSLRSLQSAPGQPQQILP